MKSTPFALVVVLLTFLSVLACKQPPVAQTNQEQPKPTTVGGPFENRDYMYYGMPEHITSIDTSPGWHQDGQKLCLSGTIFQPDGRTPAPDVILYYYQTNVAGRYQRRPEVDRSMPPNNLGQTHGHIRGWVKSDENGRYTIYTVRPGAYPDGSEAEHIHLNIKEPDHIREYYIDDIVFDDDPMLTEAKRNRLENRGGSGIVKLVEKGNIFVGQRDITLGLGIPDYPVR